MRRLRFTPEARADLIAAYFWLDERNPRFAARWHEAVREKCRRLRHMPGIGAPRDDRFPGLRVVHEGAYAIYHSITEDEVVIVRILHGSRDHDAILGD